MSPEGLFSALGNATRLRCVMLLLGHDELCVCELTYAIGVSQPHISRHLAQLRELGLVTDRRVGVWVYYRISPELPEWVFRVLAESLQGLGGQSPFSDDRQALSSMPNRPGAERCA